MFHRRLLLLFAVSAVIVFVLMGQMVRLSVVEGADRLAAAESKLDIRTFLPTHRGRILDRHGRVLAMDKASSDVAVEYTVITGTWMRDKARSEAINAISRKQWNTLSPAQREAAIQERLPQWNTRRDQLWGELSRLGDIPPDELLRRLDAIKSSVQTTAAMVWERQRQQEELEYGVKPEEFKPRPIKEQREAHVILSQVRDDVAMAFRKFDHETPGMVEVRDASRREYPWSNASVTMHRSGLPRPIRSDTPVVVPVIGVADHILGTMRNEVWETDVTRRPFRNPTTGTIDLGWYQPGDSVGSRGIERVYEDHLRGRRGEVHERLDTGEKIRTEAVPGNDLHLTIDIALQARVQALLLPEFGLTRVQEWHRNSAVPVGTPLNAAAVVVEVESGEILAMVSMPTIAMGEMMSAEWRERNQPIVNRPAEAIYPPGSIIKPLTLAAAVADGLHSIDAAITCNGHYFPALKDRGRCWIYREEYGLTTHGALHAAEALARSCNIYFYTLGDRLGMSRLVNWFARFGMGQPLHIGLLHDNVTKDGKTIQQGESGGSLPNEAYINQRREQGQLKFDEVIMGIGQGPITWTPVQAANAYATLARGGTIRDATLILNQSHAQRSARTTDLPLSQRLVDVILDGLQQSVMQRHGTGHHITYSHGDEEPIINTTDVQVWAKTGTATADRSRGLDHSWFVGLVGPKAANKPMHAVAVLVENGGSGGRTAGPIANQIIRALQAEGYLPGDPNAATSTTYRGGSHQPEPDHDD